MHTNLLDMPNRRSSHTVPTPRGGGVGIVLSCLAIIFVLGLLGLLGLIEQRLMIAPLIGYAPLVWLAFHFRAGDSAAQES